MKYTREVFAEAATKSFSIAGVLRHLGVRWTGGSHAHISRQLKKFEIDTAHFTGAAHNRGKTSPRRLRPEEILVARPEGSRRVKPLHLGRALIESGVAYSCSICSIPGQWRGKPLILHVDHIDGDFCDSRRANLRFLCPNCHTQTVNYAGRATNRGPGPATPPDTAVAAE
jgi:5-methylcytosine-specific restriction endonuclease McrA